MIRNYILVALRQFRRNRLYTGINTAGLSIGMAVTLLIGLWVHDELAFNTSIPNNTRIAELMHSVVYNGQPTAFSGAPLAILPELRNKYAGDFKYIVPGSYAESHVLTSEDKGRSKSLSVIGEYMGEEVTKLLSLKMIAGDPAGLHDQSAVFLSSSTATALFGSAEPVGRTIRLDTAQLLTVAGVYADLPQNSSFADLHFIASADLYAAMHPQTAASGNPWQTGNLISVYVELADGTDMTKVNDKIRLMRKDKMPLAAFNANPDYELLYPLDRWHLYAPLQTPDTRNPVQYVWLLGSIGVFVLLLACINFINLSTARSEKRAREVGIRKTIGSGRYQLIGQFFAESLLAVILSFLLSLLWAQLLLPVFNDLAEKTVAIPWTSPGFWMVGAATVLVTAVLAGSYPAFYLSSFRPVETLKGRLSTGSVAALPRKALVILQFTIAVSLVIDTIVVYRQITYARQRPIGYSKSGLLTLNRTPALEHSFEAFRGDLRSDGAVMDAALVTSTPTQIMGDDLRFDWKGKDPSFTPYIPISSVTPNYGTIIGWKVGQGRDFDPGMTTDSTAMILNEAAVRLMGFRQPIGETVQWRGKPFHVIGVTRDIVDQSPYQPTSPEIFTMSGYEHRWAVILRVNPKLPMSAALGRIKTIYARYETLYPMDYSFTDREYAKKFGAEERIGRLSLLFTIFAISICCLGLFGMAAYMAEQRRREIGIRKVLGATTVSLWRLLSRDLALLVAISLVAAGPLSWSLMTKWLQQYPYRTSVEWWVIAAAGAGALFIAVATISYQTIRASLVNPTKTLRSE
jgi:putative ABC transport system permease protein